MGLDLWFREDVVRILASASETMRMSQNATAPLDPEMAALYQQGFGDALRAVALAFGVPARTRTDGTEWSAMTVPVRSSADRQMNW